MSGQIDEKNYTIGKSRLLQLDQNKTHTENRTLIYFRH